MLKLPEGIPPEQMVVVMLCGPHADETNRTYSPMFYRIDAAIETALAHGLRLMVAGDATQGRDVALFAARARAAGVEAVEVYDPLGHTEADVGAVLRRLTIQEYSGVNHLVLVTDWWHMNRVYEWFTRLMPQILGSERVIGYSFRPVMNGPMPAGQQISGENKGIVDCRLGRARDPYGPPIGKPIPEATTGHDFSGHASN